MTVSSSDARPRAAIRGHARPPDGGICFGGICRPVVAVLTYRSNDERAKAVDNLNATVERITQIRMVWSHLKDAESAKRGYLLSGQEQTLERSP